VTAWLLFVLLILAVFAIAAKDRYKL
jgi:hypothetical protein